MAITLTDNLTYSGSAEAIDVRSNDVFIDMNGFVLTGPGASGNSADGIAVLSGQQRLTVVNGTIEKFGSQGIT